MAALGEYTPSELWLPFYIPPSQRSSSKPDPTDGRSARRIYWILFIQKKKRYPLLPAYDLCLKCSHLFNILDARGAISVTERVGVIARVRALAVGIAKAYVDQQQGKTPASEQEPEKKPKATKKLQVAPTAS